MTSSDYDVDALADAFYTAGLRPSDVVFSHSNIGFLGIPALGRSSECMCQTVYEAFFRVIGQSGTLIVPTFTYSWCKGLVFDPQESSSNCGIFSEWVRKKPEAVRSHEPIFSVAAVGEHAVELCTDIGNSCFGRNSIWSRLEDIDALILNINMDAGSTFLHYVERELGVTYRYDKLFSGARCIDGILREGLVTYFCHDLSRSDTDPSFLRFHEVVMDDRYAVQAEVGRGIALAIRAKQARKSLEELLAKEPWAMTRSSEDNSVPSRRKIETVRADIKLAHRGIPGISGPVVDAVAAEFIGSRPHEIRRYRTGQNVGGALVPEVWSLRDIALTEVGTGAPVLPSETLAMGVVPYSNSVEARIRLDSSVLTNVALNCIGELLPEESSHQPGVYFQGQKAWGIRLQSDFLRPLFGVDLNLRLNSMQYQGAVNVIELAPPTLSPECGLTILPRWEGDSVSCAWTLVEWAIELWDKQFQREGLWRLVFAPGILARKAWFADLEAAHGGMIVEVSMGGEQAILEIPHRCEFKPFWGIAERRIEGDHIHLQISSIEDLLHGLEILNSVQI